MQKLLAQNLYLVIFIILLLLFANTLSSFENFSSDWGHVYWGVYPWNGWPY